MKLSNEEMYLEAIREACVEAGADVSFRICADGEKHLGYQRGYCSHGHFLGYMNPVEERPIRLADVLLALDGKREDVDNYEVDTNGEVFSCIHIRAETGDDGLPNDTNRHKYLFTWNLREDDLTKQSPECLAFLYELLK